MLDAIQCGLVGDLVLGLEVLFAQLLLHISAGQHGCQRCRGQVVQSIEYVAKGREGGMGGGLRTTRLFLGQCAGRFCRHVNHRTSSTVQRVDFFQILFAGSLVGLLLGGRRVCGVLLLQVGLGSGVVHDATDGRGFLDRSLWCRRSEIHLTRIDGVFLNDLFRQILIGNILVLRIFLLDGGCEFGD